MFDPTILSFRILPNHYQIDIAVETSQTGDTPAWTHIGVEIEGASKGQVKADMATTDRSRKGSLQTNLVPTDLFNSRLCNTYTSIRQLSWLYVDLVPFNGYLK